MMLREINSALAKKRREHYPADERAGFNYGKAICSMIESLAINEDDFIRGMMKPLTSRQKYVEAQMKKAHEDEYGKAICSMIESLAIEAQMKKAHEDENKRLQMQAGGAQ